MKWSICRCQSAQLFQSFWAKSTFAPFRYPMTATLNLVLFSSRNRTTAISCCLLVSPTASSSKAYEKSRRTHFAMSESTSAAFRSMSFKNAGTSSVEVSFWAMPTMATQSNPKTTQKALLMLEGRRTLGRSGQNHTEGFPQCMHAQPSRRFTSTTDNPASTTHSSNPTTSPSKKPLSKRLPPHLSVLA